MLAEMKRHTQVTKITKKRIDCVVFTDVRWSAIVFHKFILQKNIIVLIINLQ